MNAYKVEVRNAKGRKTRNWVQFSKNDAQAKEHADKHLCYPEDGEHITMLEEGNPSSSQEASLWHFGALLQDDKVSQMEKEGCTDLERVHFSAWPVKIKKGRKYINVDLGSSGKYMITPDGEIFGIKGYGVIHRGHQYGTLETSNEWYWGLYKGVRVDERIIPQSFLYEGTELAKLESVPKNDKEEATGMGNRGKVNISEDVEEVLRSAEVEGNTLKLVGQLDRPLYTATNKVLVAIGGKWNKSARVHIFTKPVAGVLAEALDKGHAIDTKKQRNQFFTPQDIARRMAELAEIEAGMCVLEPNAGSGRIVQAVIDSVDTEILGYEIDEGLCFALRSEFPGYKLQVRNKDFLTVTEHIGEYPRVIMNPPFENGVDIKHILHGLEMLKSGGILVALCANGPKQNEKLKPLADHWEELPEGSFKSEGTGVNVALMVIRKD